MLRIAACLLSSLATLALVRQDPATEPPLQMKLHMDGQQFALVPGVETEIAIGDRRSKVKIVVEPHRHFQGAGIEFDYPAEMAFEYEGGAPEMWTLDGANVVVHVHRHGTGKARPMMRATLTGMLATLDEEAKPPERSELTLGATKREVLIGKASVGPATICVTAIGIDVGDDAIVLMVQDTLADDGSQSAECKRVLEVLAKTFKLTAK